MAKRAGKKKQDRSDSSEPGSSGDGEQQTVDRMLIALQKTLSRVSRDSAGVPRDQARSLIVGKVGFDLSVRCSLGPGEKLLLDSESGSPLRLTGEMTSDIDVEPSGGDLDADS